jgi:hypothetical protein
MPIPILFLQVLIAPILLNLLTIKAVNNLTWFHFLADQASFEHCNFFGGTSHISSSGTLT